MGPAIKIVISSSLITAKSNLVGNSKESPSHFPYDPPECVWEVVEHLGLYMTIVNAASKHISKHCLVHFEMYTCFISQFHSNNVKFSKVYLDHID